MLNVITREGIRKRLTETNREEIIKTLQPGYIVERQLVDGDIGLMNRQPTLHRLSVMAHRVKVLPGRTIRIHVSTCLPYNADFDGDEMNFHLPQSLEAQAEARYLMQPKDLILSPRDGKPIMAIEEDEVIGMFFLTRDGATFAKDEACLLLSTVGIYELPKPDRKGLYSGKDIFSMLLPKDLNFEGKEGSHMLTIKKGVITDGMVSGAFVGEGGGTLLLKIFEDYGAEFTTEFLLKMAKMSVRVAAFMGTTISVRDYYKSEQLNKELGGIMSDVEAKADELVKKYKDKKLESLPGYTMKETLEMEIKAELEGARTMAANVLRKNISPEANNTMMMVRAGARGSIMQFVQTCMLLGQQSVRGKRPTRGYSGRVLPYFKPNDKNPTSKGFVKSSFFTGLQPVEFFMHAMGSRDSAMSKSLVIAQSGYLQRRLVNAMQDFYVDDMLSVKDASGSLIQTLYGGDGIDPTKERLGQE